MNRHRRHWLFACAISAHLSIASAAQDEFSVAVIAHPFQGISDASVLRQSIGETDEDNLAFVVASGVKAITEPCSDDLYRERRDLFESAKNGLIVSLAASDWTECRNSQGKPAAMERLNQLRDLFFPDEFSLGGTKLPVTRQSTIVRFRSYTENARWEFRRVMFATINLPQDNNHYSTAAGRNSEFEDRLVANRSWLQRIFTQATRRKFKAIVLFCDGNPLVRPALTPGRDGFAEIRQQIMALAMKFPGKTLIIHNPASAKSSERPRITWRGNLGQLELAPRWTRLNVNPSSLIPFSVETGSAKAPHS